MSYLSLQPFMNDPQEFERYTTFEDRRTSIYYRYLAYDDKMNQVVARMFRLAVLREEGKSDEQILKYRRNYAAPFNPLSEESRSSVLERALSEEQLKTLPSEQYEEERLRLDYVLFHAQHELRDKLNEYTINTMMICRPNATAGISLLVQGFEQDSVRDQVEAVIACYQRMLERIKEVKGWKP